MDRQSAAQLTEEERGRHKETGSQAYRQRVTERKTILLRE